MQTLLAKWPAAKAKLEISRQGGSLGRYGAGISSADLADFSPTSQDARPLPDLPVPPQQQQPAYSENGSFVETLSTVDTERTPRLNKTRQHTLHNEDQEVEAKRSRSRVNDYDEFGGPLASISVNQSAPVHYHTLPVGGADHHIGAPIAKAKSMLVPPRASSTKSVKSGSTATTAVAGPSGRIGQEPPLYGYSTVGWDAPMDEQRAAELIMACGDQIRKRGLDSPLIFSSMALDLSLHNVNSLLRSYLSAPSAAKVEGGPDNRGPGLPVSFSSDIRFANVHDLAAVIKWSLARLGRVFTVPVPLPPSNESRLGRRAEPLHEENIFVQQRGFLDLDSYSAWAQQEKASGYPASAFNLFLTDLSSPTVALLIALFSLLSSTTSYSEKNGMPPSKLARLFGPLIFGLPEDDTFERTYNAYIKAGNATEHLLLAYIRDTSTLETLPTKLASHIQGYPGMLSSDVFAPSRSARSVPITSVERAVRLYSVDLVKTACELDLSEICQEWAACCTEDDHYGRDPQLSDRYRKLINLRGSVKQGRSKSQIQYDGGLSSGRESTSSAGPDIESYSTLASKEWGDFMTEGFAAPDESKLAFDLRESERKARSQKRETVQWSDFETSGFSLADEGLASVLSFDDSLQDDVKKWPEEKQELMNKLRQKAMALPAFPYDTTPHLLASPSKDGVASGQWDERPISRMDELFAEVWADYLLGNGWSNRDEMTHRGANFVVVQYKSRPNPSTVGSQSKGASSKTSAALPSRNEFGQAVAADPRSDAAWFIVQEVVPQQYRSELDAAGRLKNRSRPTIRKLNIFKRSNKKGGNVHQNQISTEDPNDVFRVNYGGPTKKIILKDPVSSLFGASPDLRRSSSTTMSRGGGTSGRRQQGASDPTGTRAGGDDGDAGGLSGGQKLLTSLKSKAMARRKHGRGEDDFTTPPLPPPKSPALISPLPKAADAKPSHQKDDSFHSSDFETRSLQENDETLVGPSRNKLINKVKRQSKDDSWLDIMLKSNDFRMAGQDAEMTVPQRKRGVAEKANNGSLTTNGHHAPDASLRDDTSVSRKESSSFDADARTPTGFGSEAHTRTFRSPFDDGLSPAAAGAAAAASVAKSQTLEAKTTPAVVAPGWSHEVMHNPVAASASPTSKLGLGISQEPKAAARPASSSHRMAIDTGDSELSYLSDDRDEEPKPESVQEVALTPPRTSVPKKKEEDEERQSPSPSAVSATSTSASASVSASGRGSEPREGDASKPYLKPVALKSLGTVEEMKERERQRDARIKAAQDRARELRANLSPVEVKAEEKRKAEREGAISPASSSGSRSLKTASPLDNPFAKNRTSGRVSSIASKFGGGAAAAAKSPSGPLSPQNTGPSTAALTPQSTGNALRKGADPVSPSPGPRVGSKAIGANSVPAQLPASATINKIPASDSAISYSMHTAPSSPTVANRPPSPQFLADPNAEPAPRPSIESSSAPSIYPDDAASNFSRDTSEDGGDGGGRASLQQRFAMSTGAFSGNGIGGGFRMVDGSNGAAGEREREREENRLEREEAQDKSTPMPLDLSLPPSFRQPYQPGMPLSNLEEESESCLSGSNI